MKIPPLRWNWSLTQVKKCTEWRNVDTSLISGNMAEASLDNRNKKGRPFQHQHAPLLIANSADVNMNGKRKCVQHGDRFAAIATSAIISRGVALQMSVQKCMSSTNNRQTLSMKCMKIASWRCIQTNRSVMYQQDPSTLLWCYLAKHTSKCRSTLGQLWMSYQQNMSISTIWRVLALSLKCTTTPRWSLRVSAYFYSKTLLMGTNTVRNFKLSRRTSSLYSAGEQQKDWDS